MIVLVFTALAGITTAASVATVKAVRRDGYGPQPRHHNYDSRQPHRCRQ